MAETIAGKGAPISTRWLVSAFTTVSWRGGRLEITSASSGAMFASDNLEVIRVVHAFAQPKTVEEVIRELKGHALEQLTACINELIGAGIVIPASAPEPAAHWDRASLAFHRNSRQLGLHKMPTPPQTTSGVAARRSRTMIPLTPGTVEKGRDLTSVLSERRSWRTWPAKPVCIQTFSTFLWLSARNRAGLQGGVEHRYVSRPYPSGGAVYSLEVYPVIASETVESIAGGLYRYLPHVHGLEPVTANSADYLPFLESAGRSADSMAPPIVLIITSHFARQSGIYGNLAYSLVLKEVGCLFQTLYLVGEYLGLSPCALGGGTPAGLLARLCNTNELAEPVVGEFMLGPR
jgi:SagB-type dehydrogenase family enzyme